MKIGKCELCHLEDQQLCDSHYLPQKVYGVNAGPSVEEPTSRDPERDRYETTL